MMTFLTICVAIIAFPIAAVLAALLLIGLWNLLKLLLMALLAVICLPFILWDWATSGWWYKLKRKTRRLRKWFTKILSRKLHNK